MPKFETCGRKSAYKIGPEHRFALRRNFLQFFKLFIFIFLANFDPYKYSNADQARVHFITYETLLEDQENQVMGLTHAGDLKGAQAAHVSLWTVSEFARIVKWGEV